MDRSGHLDHRELLEPRDRLVQLAQQASPDQWALLVRKDRLEL